MCNYRCNKVHEIIGRVQRWLPRCLALGVQAFDGTAQRHVRRPRRTARSMRLILVEMLGGRIPSSTTSRL
jgi:hypothetical protein